MSDELHCGFCQQVVEALTRYSVGTIGGLMICAGCYAMLVAKAHHPYAQVTQRLYRQLGLATGRRS